MKTIKIVTAPEAYKLAQSNQLIKFRVLGSPQVYVAIGINPLHGGYHLQYFDEQANLQTVLIEVETMLIEILAHLAEGVDTSDFVDVVFRRWRSGGKELIALFPHTIADVFGYKCNSYMHVGQHSGADYMGLLSTTRLVNPQDDEEARDLINELQNIGYKLQFVRKVNHTKLRKARKEFREGR